MKKFFQTAFKAMLAICALGFAACSSDDSDDAAKTTTVTFEEKSWTKHIDSPQYYGPLLYGNGEYSWTDPLTTLSSELTNDYGDGFYWGGGVAISNYVHDGDVSGVTYEQQLAVAKTNGSRNFAVACSRSYIYFKDKSVHVIESMSVSPTAYVLNVVKYGNSFSAPLTKPSDFFKVVATGYAGDVKTGSTDIYLVRNGVIQEGWTTASLASLGKVNKVVFTFDGSDTGDYGLNTPQYFALDNIVVAD